MLYSSCKNSVVDVVEKHYNIQIDKKVEVDSGSELTEDYLMVNIILSFLFFINHFGTYVRTYVQVSFPRSHPTLKLIRQKISEIIQVPNFSVLPKSKK